MARHLFVPVVSVPMLRTAATISAFLGGAAIHHNVHASGWKKGFERRFGTGCLSTVGANDALFIVAHGAGYPGSGSIGETRADGVMKKYTMKELAGVLAAEGLNKRFRDLHMFTCGSGLMNKAILRDVSSKAGAMLGLKGSVVTDRDPKVATTYKQKDPIARLLCEAMKAEGFRMIQVTGYLGDIVTRPPNRVTVEEWFTGDELGLDWKVVAT